ncbi:hypothetical protein N9C10_04430 [Flavobacteriaceae bacterium]|nr:hypothetical protein [Flavobacteriaceae bacterium]
MECSVCYNDDVSTCKLVCGHEFCMSCIKKWYLKSEEEATCPMCRQRLYFRGMRNQEEQWVKEREQGEIDNAFENCFNFQCEMHTETVESAMESAKEDDFFLCDVNLFNEFFMENLCSMEKLFNKYSKFNWDYWEDFEEAVNQEYECPPIKPRLYMYYELLMKYNSLIKISKNNSKHFYSDIKSNQKIPRLFHISAK